MQHMYLAKEVIREACSNYAAGQGPDGRFDFDSVLHRRFPIGPGGVGMQNRKTQKAIREAIKAFYDNSDLPERNT